MRSCLDLNKIGDLREENRDNSMKKSARYLASKEVKIRGEGLVSESKMVKRQQGIRVGVN